MRACIALVLLLGGCSLDTVSQGVDAASSAPRSRPSRSSTLRCAAPGRARRGGRSWAEEEVDGGDAGADDGSSRKDAGRASRDRPATSAERDDDDAKPVQTSDDPQPAPADA